MNQSFSSLFILLSVVLLFPAQAGVFEPQVEAFESALGTLEMKPKGSVLFARDRTLGAESYSVEVVEGDVVVRAGDAPGAAYAAADLLRRATLGEDGSASWADGKWSATPDFPYRSFMVDMGRNPQSPKVLRHVVDMMWFYRGNYLQLHLTDDQLFSWPSKAYPELYSPHAGWTLDEFRKLEAYSQARGVTIVPELEVPGHSSILRGRRPDVFGKEPTDLATSPKAQKGVETLIDEMLDVFQATPYMHIGADEAWGVPVDIQRDFINRINRHVRSRGRTTLAWEGPNLGEGDNKVSEDVVHLAWESKYLPMTAMVEAGYTVINAAWDPFYIVDHYPRNNFTGVALDTIYNMDLRRMKAVDPGLPSYLNPQMLENTDDVLGFTMPYWEGREHNLLPMCLKRFAAASTRAWDYDSERPYTEYAAHEDKLLPRLETFSGFKLPEMPVAKAEDVKGNLAFGGKVTPSKGAHQPHFVPARLTNGITDRYDLFIGYPTRPEPLLIDIELPEAAEISRVRIHEISSAGGWEKYRLLLSTDGKAFEKVAETKKGDRGDKTFVEHTFDKRGTKVIRIETDGFEHFTFPSFSRLTEVEAFAE